MQIKFNHQKKTTSLSHQGLVIKESSMNFDFSTKSDNAESKSISLISILTNFESLLSLFLLFKGTPFYQVLSNNLSVENAIYAVNFLINPLNN